MPTLTIRNVPDELHEVLKERARKNRRSVNQEVIAELSDIAKITGDNASDARWERANKLVEEMRSKMSGFLSAKEIRSAIEEGRM